MVFATHDPFFSPKWLIPVPTEHDGPEIGVSDSPTLAANVRLMLYTHSPLLRITFSQLFWSRYGSSQLTDTYHRHIDQVPFCPPGCCLHPWSSYRYCHKIFVCLYVFKSRMVKGLASTSSLPDFKLSKLTGQIWP